MEQNTRQQQPPDFIILVLYMVMIITGWLNIFAAVYDADANMSIFDFSLNSGKQLIWIGLSLILITGIMTVDFKVFSTFAWPIYGVVMLSLALVLVAGKEVAGSRSWFAIGPFALQPAEFAKFATALALARFLDTPGKRLSSLPDLGVAIGIILIPMGLILLQNDTGSVLVFASLIVMLYRMGLNPLVPLLGILAAALFVLTLLVDQTYLIVGLAVIAIGAGVWVRRKWKQLVMVAVSLALVIGVVTGVDYFFNKILKPHQQKRIVSLINPDIDPLGAGWNITQSKIAIGSGGLNGKGFLQGTQTKFDFVPEQSTDFIFCTIAEEHGFVGSLFLVLLYTTLLIRLIMISERQKATFAKVYGYCVTGYFFFHFFVNIGMTVGLLPIIGIPLPFFSYGGSSLFGFTVLLFILLKLDVHRTQLLGRD